MVWMINKSDAQRSVANLEVEHLGANLLLAFCSFGFQRKHLVTCWLFCPLSTDLCSSKCVEKVCYCKRDSVKRSTLDLQNLLVVHSDSLLPLQLPRRAHPLSLAYFLLFPVSFSVPVNISQCPSQVRSFFLPAHSLLLPLQFSVWCQDTELYRD